ncbi:MAG: PTS glucose transporter subunit IIA [Lachnospiraceae bacterium]|nr:PTS glucose transporter subunit IIA [Lachnospiraceae bacterium]
MFDFLKKKADPYIYAPVQGKLIDIATVSDITFAQKLLGDGVAFSVNEGKATVYAPVSGKLETLFPTLHAFGIQMDNGVSVLVHIGVNTVDANGTGFKVCAKKQGDKVKAGDAIVEVDFDLLKQTYDTSVMLVILDPADKNITFEAPMDVALGTVVGTIQ